MFDSVRKRVAGASRDSAPLQRLVASCHKLLTERGEAAGVSLARATLDQKLGFAQQFLVRARDFSTAGIGHDAVGAELVAPFLHGQEGTRPHATARG